MKDVKLSNYDRRNITAVPAEYVKRVYETGNKIYAETKDGTIVELGMLIAPSARNLTTATINPLGELECSFDNGDTANLGYVGNTITRTLPTFVNDGIFSGKINDFKSLRTFVNEGGVEPGASDVLIKGTSLLTPNIAPNVFNPHEVTELTITPTSTGILNIPTEMGDNTLIWDDTTDGEFTLEPGTYTFDIKSYSTATGKTLIKLVDVSDGSVLAVSNTTISTGTPGNALPLFICDLVKLDVSTTLKVVQTTEDASPIGIGTWTIERWCVDIPIITAYIVKTSDTVAPVSTPLLAPVSTESQVLNNYLDSQSVMPPIIDSTFLTESHFYDVKDKWTIGDWVYITSINKPTVIVKHITTGTVTYIDTQGGQVVKYQDGIVIVCSEEVRKVELGVVVKSISLSSSITLPCMVDELGTQLLSAVNTFYIPEVISEGLVNPYYTLEISQEPISLTSYASEFLQDKYNGKWFIPKTTAMPLDFVFTLPSKSNVGAVEYLSQLAHTVSYEILTETAPDEWTVHDSGIFEASAQGPATVVYFPAIHVTKFMFRITDLKGQRAAILHLSFQSDTQYRLLDLTTGSVIDSYTGDTNVLSHIPNSIPKRIDFSQDIWSVHHDFITSSFRNTSTLPIYTETGYLETSLVHGRLAALDLLPDRKYVHSHRWERNTPYFEGMSVTGTGNPERLMSDESWTLSKAGHVTFTRESLFTVEGIEYDSSANTYSPVGIYGKVTKESPEVLITTAIIQRGADIVRFPKTMSLYSLTIREYDATTHFTNATFTQFRLIENFNGGYGEPQLITGVVTSDSSHVLEGTLQHLLDDTSTTVVKYTTVDGLPIDLSVPIVIDFESKVWVKEVKSIKTSMSTGDRALMTDAMEIEYWSGSDWEPLDYLLVKDQIPTGDIVSNFDHCATDKLRVTFIKPDSASIIITDLVITGTVVSQVTGNKLLSLPLDFTGEYGGPQVTPVKDISVKPDVTLPLSTTGDSSPGIYNLSSVPAMNANTLYKLLKRNAEYAYHNGRIHRSDPMTVTIELLDKVRVIDTIEWDWYTRVVQSPINLMDVSVDVLTDELHTRSVDTVVSDWEEGTYTLISSQGGNDIIYVTSHEQEYYGEVPTALEPARVLTIFEVAKEIDVVKLTHARKNYYAQGEWLSIDVLIPGATESVAVGNTFPVNSVSYNASPGYTISATAPQGNTTNRSLDGVFSSLTAWYYRANEFLSAVPITVEVEFDSDRDIDQVSYHHASDTVGAGDVTVRVETKSPIDGTWTEVLVSTPYSPNTDKVTWDIPLTSVNGIRLSFTTAVDSTRRLSLRGLTCNEVRVLPGTWLEVYSGQDISIYNNYTTEHRFDKVTTAAVRVTSYNTNDSLFGLGELVLCNSESITDNWLRVYSATVDPIDNVKCNFPAVEVSTIRITAGQYRLNNFGMSNLRVSHEGWVPEIELPTEAIRTDMSLTSPLSLVGPGGNRLVPWRMYEWGTGIVTDTGTIINLDGTTDWKVVGNLYTHKDMITDSGPDPKDKLRIHGLTGVTEISKLPPRMLETTSAGGLAYKYNSRSAGGLHWLVPATGNHLDVYDENTDTLTRVETPAQVHGVYRGTGNEVIISTNGRTFLTCDGTMSTPARKIIVNDGVDDYYHMEYYAQFLSGSTTYSSSVWDIALNGDVNWSRGYYTYASTPSKSVMWSTDDPMEVQYLLCIFRAMEYASAVSDFTIDVSMDGITWDRHLVTKQRIGTSEHVLYSLPNPIVGKYFKVWEEGGGLMFEYLRFVSKSSVGLGNPTYNLTEHAFYPGTYVDNDHYIGAPKTITYENVNVSEQRDEIHMDFYTTMSSRGINSSTPYTVIYTYEAPTVLTQLEITNGNGTTRLVDIVEIYGQDELGEWTLLQTDNSPRTTDNAYIKSRIVKMTSSIPHIAYKFVLKNSNASYYITVSNIVAVTEGYVKYQLSPGVLLTDTTTLKDMVSDTQGHVYANTTRAIVKVNCLTKEVQYISWYTHYTGSIYHKYWDHVNDRLLILTTIGVYTIINDLPVKIAERPTTHPYPAVNRYERTLLRTDEALLIDFADGANKKLYLEDVRSRLIERVVPKGLSSQDSHSQGSYGPDGKLYMTSSNSVNSIITINPEQNDYDYIEGILDNGDKYLKPALTKSGDLLFFPHTYTTKAEEFKAYRFKFEGVTEVPDSVLNSIFYR